ncbi:DUF1660 family phage protein [Sphingomonas oryzagri]|uniref:DUF1660 family phage protein n=1 Tax=Sphingomonas oryzagri TaxID=3042314 RepID=A0ABT6N6M9_9SPHN|nr:DUF1660 family phage protein [Sphingomonas oryzagri]MDH7640784.1 DUF1660 family phage protein [Sphingomonas oryzagri]
MQLPCAIFGHKPDKTRVWNDNVDFRAPCIRCGAAMLRDERKNWRLFDDEMDGASNRKQHRHEKGEEL